MTASAERPSMRRSTACAAKTLKVERIYQLHYDTRAQARLDIVDWIEGYYNRERLHTSIDFQTPVDYEAGLIAA